MVSTPSFSLSSCQHICSGHYINILLLLWSLRHLLCSYTLVKLNPSLWHWHNWLALGKGTCSTGSNCYCMDFGTHVGLFFIFQLVFGGLAKQTYGKSRIRRCAKSSVAARIPDNLKAEKVTTTVAGPADSKNFKTHLLSLAWSMEQMMLLSLARVRSSLLWVVLMGKTLSPQ